jgi:CO/xanthine dehydrogenase FAD-binding subunit
MLPNLIEYHWAEQLDDALLLLARLDVKTVPLAGGTYLLSLEDETIQAVVDLRDLGLSYISEDARGIAPYSAHQRDATGLSSLTIGNAASAATATWSANRAEVSSAARSDERIGSIHIGAMTTLQQIADAPLLKEYASGLLAQAARYSSPSHLIRNSATIGGTLGAGVASQADLWTALVALDAEAVLRSGSRTQVNLSGGTVERPGLPLAGVIYKGKQERRIPCRELSLERRPSELIIEVVIPHFSYAVGASLMRIGRTATDNALLNVAAFVEIENGHYSKLRLAFGGVNMEAVRVEGVEQQLEGQPVTQDVDGQVIAALRAGMGEFHPPADVLVSSGYRRIAGMNLAYHALEEAMNIARWRATMVSGENPEITTRRPPRLT